MSLFVQMFNVQVFNEPNTEMWSVLFLAIKQTYLYAPYVSLHCLAETPFVIFFSLRSFLCFSFFVLFCSLRFFISCESKLLLNGIDNKMYGDELKICIECLPNRRSIEKSTIGKIDGKKNKIECCAPWIANCELRA